MEIKKTEKQTDLFHVDLENSCIPVDKQKFRTRTRSYLPLLSKEESNISPQKILHEMMKDNGIRIVKSGLKCKEIKELHIGVMENRKKIQNGDFLDRVTMIYRDIFGHGQPVDEASWGEYMKCNPCGTKKSIEEVFELSEYMFLSELEKNGIPEQICECGCEMDHFHDHSITNEIIRKDFDEKEMFAVFLIDNEGISHGFSYAWKSTIKNLWEEKLVESYAHSKLDYETYLSNIITNGRENFNENTPIIYWAEIGQTVNARNGENPFLLAGTLFQSINNNHQSFPVFVGVNQELRSYAFVRAAGGIDVCRSEDADRVIVCGDTSQFGVEYSLGSKFSRKHRKVIRSVMKSVSVN